MTNTQYLQNAVTSLSCVSVCVRSVGREYICDFESGEVVNHSFHIPEEENCEM